MQIALRGEASSTVSVRSATSCLLGHLARCWTDNTRLVVTFQHTESPAQASAFSGGQLLTVPKALLGGLPSAIWADLIWKVISGRLSKDCKCAQRD